MPNDDMAVYFGNDGFSEEQPCWYLLIQRSANAEDLERNQFLEEEGDSLWSTMVEITHCPYCGESLYEGLERPSETMGQSVLIDNTASWYAQKK